MSILISLIVVLVIAGVVFWLVGMIPMDGRLKQIVYVLCALVLVIYLVNRFMPGVV